MSQITVRLNSIELNLGRHTVLIEDYLTENDVKNLLEKSEKKVRGRIESVLEVCENLRIFIFEELGMKFDSCVELFDVLVQQMTFQDPF